MGIYNVDLMLTHDVVSILLKVDTTSWVNIESTLLKLIQHHESTLSQHWPKLIQHHISTPGPLHLVLVNDTTYMTRYFNLKVLKHLLYCSAGGPKALEATTCHNSVHGRQAVAINYCCWQSNYNIWKSKALGESLENIYINKPIHSALKMSPDLLQRDILKQTLAAKGGEDTVHCDWRPQHSLSHRGAICSHRRT